MTTAKSKDILTGHIQGLFDADGRVDVEELKRGKTPKLPVKEADLDDKAKVWIAYPPAKEFPRSLSGGAVPWAEVGAAMIHVIVAGQSKAAADLADEIGKTIRDSLRNGSLGADDDMDILSFYGTELAFEWAGSMSGESFAVEFETEDV